MKSFAKLLKNTQKPSLIGVSENQAYRCFVWENVPENKTEISWQVKAEDNDFSWQQAVKFPENSTFVRSIPFQYIWRKYLFLPLSYSQTMIYRQIVQVLCRELPIALEEVYFDYQLFPLPNDGLVRVLVYALRRNYADLLLLQTDTILDCELYCFVRGFNYLSNSTLAQEDKVYTLENKTFRLTAKALEFSSDLTQANCDLSHLELPGSTKDPFLYVTALGASLWNGKG
ncbi:pilus assembly protein PilM [Actinobacillus equuli subsp. haemolyticus]|nr:pilus assembly protein PilM [Actinobacillus equuli subsp. haemolyticus]